MDIGLFDFVFLFQRSNDNNSLMKYFYTNTILDHFCFKRFQIFNVLLNYCFFLDVYEILGTHEHAIFRLRSLLFPTHTPYKKSTRPVWRMHGFGRAESI
jgi:hypothetical protein